MMFGRLFRSAKDDGRKSAYRDPRELGERELADIGLRGPSLGRSSFEHAPVEVPNDRI